MARFVQTRDRGMFERLFQRHRRSMVAYAGRYVRNAARAEELAQEIFVRVYTTKAYTPTASFKTWLYRVATNVCLNELRRPENKQMIESIDAEGRDGELRSSDLSDPSSSSPETQLAERQLALRLESVLARLPEKQRAAFIMARHENMSHDQIADALSTSIPAVKSLIHRALESLRKEAQALLGSEPHEPARPGANP
jgi:RNA polymerase sigma-70 factor (ECF subfamily)